jgi:hypothetical protein
MFDDSPGELRMSVSLLLKGVKEDTTGVEVALRVVGSREPPSKMLVQIDVQGSAQVQIQGRVARDAPWVNIGTRHEASSLMHFDPVQFLRAVTSGTAAASTVSVWAVWAW